MTSFPPSHVSIYMCSADIVVATVQTLSYSQYNNRKPDGTVVFDMVDPDICLDDILDIEIFYCDDDGMRCKLLADIEIIDSSGQPATKVVPYTLYSIGIYESMSPFVKYSTRQGEKND